MLNTDTRLLGQQFGRLIEPVIEAASPAPAARLDRLPDTASHVQIGLVISIDGVMVDGRTDPGIDSPGNGNRVITISRGHGCQNVGSEGLDDRIIGRHILICAQIGLNRFGIVDRAVRTQCGIGQINNLLNMRLGNESISHFQRVCRIVTFDKFEVELDGLIANNDNIASR